MRKKRAKRKRLRDAQQNPVGAAPGTLIPGPEAQPTIVRATAYNKERIVQHKIDDLLEVKQILSEWPVVWLDVEGFENVSQLKQIAQVFDIHGLAMEDIVTHHQRAKFDEYGDQYFLVAHLAKYAREVTTEQVSLVLKKNLLITFHAEKVDCLEPVTERMYKMQGTIREAGADYLMYAMTDAIVDTFFPILEEYGERLEDIEDQIIEAPTRQLVALVHAIKRDLLLLRRAIWPMREAINAALRDSSKQFTDETRIHFRDTYDHVIQITDFIETYRELGADLMDVYLSSVSNRTNDVMKVLAIMTMLFAPPSLVAAIFGMNFNTSVSKFNQPELSWYFGYPYALALMVISASLALWFMIWKGWIADVSARNGNNFSRSARSERSESSESPATASDSSS